MLLATLRHFILLNPNSYLLIPNYLLSSLDSATPVRGGCFLSSKIFMAILGHQQKPVFNHTSRMVYLRLNVLVSRRAAENAELASRFALAVGLAECYPDGNIRAIAMYASVFCASA